MGTAQRLRATLALAVLVLALHGGSGFKEGEFKASRAPSPICAAAASYLGSTRRRCSCLQAKQALCSPDLLALTYTSSCCFPNFVEVQGCGLL